MRVSMIGTKAATADEFGFNSDEDEILKALVERVETEEKEVKVAAPVVRGKRDLSDVMLNLKSVFGFSGLREGQRDAIDILMNGSSALAVFPTGAGKSLCFQLPATLYDFTVVVSPLIALMLDQVEYLQSKGVAARFLNSTLSLEQLDQTFAAIRDGSCKVLYVAPERFQKEDFLAAVQPRNIDLFVIDEAHCISEWGIAFRPDYLLLKSIIAERLNVSRVLCCTATATVKVTLDIMKTFGIPKENLVRTKFHRPNLHIRCSATSEVNRNDALARNLAKDLADGSPYRGCGIVYCTTQACSAEVAKYLCTLKYDAKCYHAGMSNVDRENVQKWFMAPSTAASPTRIVVATIAFGMGVDKADIRFVYHYNMPKSIESFCQEIGRGGRDGLPTVCRTLLCADDMPLLESFANGDTPSRSTCESLLRCVFYDENGEPRPMGSIAEVKQYDISQECDVRPNTVNIVYCHLGVYGRYLRPLGQVKRGPTPSKERVYHRYKVLRHPPDFSVLIDEVFERQAMRERQELERLQDVVDLLTSPTCLARVLLNHFGEEKGEGWTCGDCQVCAGDGAVAMPPASARSCGSSLDEILEIMLGGPSSAILAHDEWRCGARFLCGITSPMITRNKLRGSAHFGKLEGAKFGEVLSILRERGEGRGVKAGGGRAAEVTTTRAPAKRSAPSQSGEDRYKKPKFVATRHH